MMNEIVVMLTLLAEAMMILKCLHVSFNRKMHCDKSTVGILVIIFIFYVIVNAAIIAPIYSIAMHILIVGYCYIQFRMPVGVTIGRFVLGLVIAGLIEVLVVCLIVPLQMIFNKQIIMLLSAIASLTVAYICPMFIKKFFRKIVSRRSVNMLWATVLFALALMGLLIDYYTNKTPVNVYAVVIMIFIWLVYIYIYMLEQTRNEMEKKKLEIELQKIYGGAYVELIEEVRKRQHDFKNQLSAIYSMHFVAQSLEELIEMQKEYGDKIIDKCRFDSILLSCGNSILAGYIYYKCISCEKAGIAISYNIQLENAQCCFSLHEIIEILGILIDNAFENVTDVNIKEKSIHLNFCEETEKIIFSVSNPNNHLTSLEIENLFLNGYSTKGKNRGIGLARVRELARQHETEIKVSNTIWNERNWIEFSVIATK